MKKIKLLAILILIAITCSGCPIPLYYGGGGYSSYSSYGYNPYGSGYGYYQHFTPFYGGRMFGGGGYHGFGGGHHGFHR